MFFYGRGRILTLVGALICVTACSGTTPTSPSSTSSSSSSSSSTASTAQQSASDSTAGTQAAIGATRFMAFGDSITWGAPSAFDLMFVAEDIAGPAAGCTVATPPGDGYPERLLGLLQSNTPVQPFGVTNCGISGETAATGEGRLSAQLAAVKPQGLLLLEGINDLNGGRSISEVVGHLRTMVEIARLYNVTVLIGTMFQTYQSEQELPDGTIRVRENARDQIQPFNDAIMQMAAGRQNVYVVDIYHAFGSNRSLVANDGLHPSPAGYQQMASWFAAAIQQTWAVRPAFQ